MGEVRHLYSHSRGGGESAGDRETDQVDKESTKVGVDNVRDPAGGELNQNPWVKMRGASKNRE